ncbi:MAG: SPOR domain-containing protein, partial [Rhodothermales bacterium]
AALTLDEGEEAARTPVLTPGEVMRASEEQQRRRMADSSAVQDWSKGGWTIHVHTEMEQQKAEAYARNFGNYLRNTGYAVEVFTALIREEVEYRVGVGLFSSELEAEQALTRLKNRVPGEARIVRIPKTSQ